MSDPAPSRPSFLRRFWRWFRWLLLTGFFGLALLIAFHRPLILWALNRFGPDLASKAGVTLKWQVEGSLRSDLSISAINADASDPGLKLTAGKLGLEYDLHPLWKGDYLHVAKGITLHDIDVTIDLRHPKPATPEQPKKPSDPKALLDLLKQLQLPNIDLANINATVMLPDATVRVTDFDLNWPTGKEGVLHIGSIEHPALEKYPLKNVTARLALEGTTVRIEELKLPPEIEVAHLHADLSKFDQHKITSHTTIRSGQATIDLKATANLETKAIDTVIDIAGITEGDAARWIKDMPPTKAKLDRLHITAKGYPMEPRNLDASIEMLVTGLAFKEYRGDRVSLTTTLKDGQFSIAPLTAEAAGNRVEVSAQIAAPAEWKDFAHAAIAAQWKLAAPALDKIAGLPVKVSGQIEGNGDAKLKDQSLESFNIALSALGLGVDDHSLKSLKATAKGDLKVISFDAKAFATAGDGQLDASGTVSMEPGTKSRATWKLVLPRPDELAKSLKVTIPPDITTGEVKSDGSVLFDLSQLKAQKFDEAKGLGTLDVKSITWKKAPCESVHAEWALENGIAQLKRSLIQLELGGNQFTVAGQMALAGDQDFTGEFMAHFHALPALKPWFNALGQKPITEGLIHLDWSGKGSLKPALKVNGKTDLTVLDLRLPDRPEKIKLETKLTHDLESATFEKLVASFGPWSADLTGKVSKTAIDLTIHHAQNGIYDLISGVVQVPLDLQAKPVPVDAAKPMHIDLRMPHALPLHQLASVANATLPDEVYGTADLSIAIDGPLNKPEAKIAFLVSDLHLPHKITNEIGNVSLNIDLKDEQLSTKVVADVKPIEPLTVTASAKVQTMPLLEKPDTAMDLPFTAEVKLDQHSFDFLKPMVPILDDFAGSAAIDLKADGTGRAPHVHGSVRVDVPHITPHDPDLPVVKDLVLHITGDGTTVRLETLHATAAGGEVNISGTCDLKDPKVPAFDIALKASDLLAVRNETMSLRTDADLRCKGIPTAAAVTGTVGLTRGRVFQEVNFLPLSKMMNDLPPLPDAQASKPSAEPNASPLPPMLKDWTFDLGIKTKDNIRLLGNVMNGGTKVDIKVTGNGAKPVVTGEVSLEQARLNLPFATLYIRKGVVALTEDKPLDPTLELMAESTVDVYDIVLRGYGRALDPKIHFASTPPLSEGDIATLIATGATTSGLKGGGANLAGRALLYAVREAYRRMFVSKSKPKKPGEEQSESRFLVQERSEDGQLGGVTGIYEFSRKMKVVGSTNKDGGFRAMFHYLFRFE